MPGIPLFLVTSIKEAHRRAPKNLYTSRHGNDPMWQVKMVSGFFQGVGVTFSYPDRNKAEAFSPYEICNPSQIIENAAPKGEPFTVQDIYKTKGFGKKNLYTDKPEKIDSWTVSLEGPSGTYIDMWYPTPGEAFNFKTGWSYTLLDLFGTIRAPLWEIGIQLEQAAAAALANQRATDAAKKAASSSGGSTSGGGGTGGGGNINLPTTQYTSQPNSQSINWWITFGGAAGYYFIGTANSLANYISPGSTGYWNANAFNNGSAIDLTINNSDAPQFNLLSYFNFHQSGTFNSPFSGLLVGAYAPLGAVGDFGIGGGIAQQHTTSTISPSADNNFVLYNIVNGGAAGWYSTNDKAALIVNVYLAFGYGGSPTYTGALYTTSGSAGDAWQLTWTPTPPTPTIPNGTIFPISNLGFTYYNAGSFGSPYNGTFSGIFLDQSTISIHT